MIDISDSPVRDLWRIFRVMAEFTEGFEELASVGPAVSIFGSARARPGERYYMLAEQTASELAKDGFAIITGGGGGIMEAANRGASEAKGMNVGLTISIPIEEFDNPFVTRELSFHFHYFFMRKFWFAYLAKAVVVFPGGFGTLDELFELLTLRQTHKIRKHLPIVLFGSDYWNEIVNWQALIDHGVIDAEDLALFHRTDSVDDAFEYLTSSLSEYALTERGAIL